MGDLRWSPPELIRHYGGDVDASKFMPMCASKNWDGENPDFSEDCLRAGFDFTIFPILFKIDLP